MLREQQYLVRPQSAHLKRGMVMIDVCACTRAEWFPSRIAFGKFKGRDFRDAQRDQPLRDWLNWLAGSSNAQSASMGRWYLERLKHVEREDEDVLSLSEAAVELDVSDEKVRSKRQQQLSSMSIQRSRRCGTWLPPPARGSRRLRRTTPVIAAQSRRPKRGYSIWSENTIRNGTACS